MSELPMLEAITIIVGLFLLYVWFQSRKSKKQRNSSKPVNLIGDGSFNYGIVGESFYQKNIKKSLNLNGEKSSKSFQVSLVYDDYNKHDSKAIAVYINGRKVGHLSKREARNYRNRMNVLGFSGRDAICDATVWGGGRKKNYGIFLDYDPRRTKKHYTVN